MTYPFEFEELLLSSKALDWLGFTEYWDMNGDTGDRRLDLGGGGAKYLIWETSDKEDDADGYGYHPIQCVTHHFFKADFKGHLYFLHELYEDIANNRTSEELNVFLTKCNDANMMPYINSYLKSKKSHEKK